MENLCALPYNFGLRLLYSLMVKGSGFALLENCMKEAKLWLFPLCFVSTLAACVSRLCIIIEYFWV